MAYQSDQTIADQAVKDHIKESIYAAEQNLSEVKGRVAIVERWNLREPLDVDYYLKAAIAELEVAVGELTRVVEPVDDGE